MTRKLALILPFCAALLMGMSKDELRQDMVRLDKVYIAALALTNQDKTTEARKAVADLTGAWRSFSDRHRAANPQDAQWQKDFDAVGRLVDEAAAIAGSERKVLEAHEPLEEVRLVMMKLRARNGIDYFVDHLTAFHEPMEEIALTARDKTPGQLTEGDMARIRERLPQAEALWQRVAAAEFDAATYQLDAEAFARARRLMQQEQQALAELRAALAAGDRARILKSAAGIKPNFAALFVTFGDFRPYRG
jgi:hypothetical protein